MTTFVLLCISIKSSCHDKSEHIYGLEVEILTFSRHSYNRGGDYHFDQPCILLQSSYIKNCNVYAQGWGSCQLPRILIFPNGSGKGLLLVTNLLFQLMCFIMLNIFNLKIISITVFKFEVSKNKNKSSSSKKKIVSSTILCYIFLLDSKKKKMFTCMSHCALYSY